MFKKLACFTGWLLVLSLSLLFCFTLGLWQNWSTPNILLFWVLMLLMVILLWSAVYALTRAVKGKRGRRWLEKYRLSRREYVLLNHWNRGASVIKRIRRQRAHLPWYLLVGDRCGKSTLLASAGLPRFDDNNDDSVPGPTRTLRWWFFRQLCILDLSSNFLNDAAKHRQAWGKLIQWSTRIPPLSGIIVALPVSALMNNDLTVLHTFARQQRTLIEPLVRRFGECLPLYVMVTQCDIFPGFSLWHRQLSTSQNQQPLGYSWPKPLHIDGQDEFALHALFTALREGMSRVRLSMGRPNVRCAEENALLLDFPEAFTMLEPKLRYVLASLCEPNAYFSPISLSSVWFSATEPQEDNLARRKSVFIQDLLDGHLRDQSQKMSCKRWYQRTQGKIFCIAILVTCTLWVTISAGLSLNRLQPGLNHLSPDALASFIQRDEEYPSTALRYLPFHMLLEKQHDKAETQLIENTGSKQRTLDMLVKFQQEVLAAPPEQQRELILQLSHAVLIWQQMRDGATLETLGRKSPIAPALLQRSYPNTLSPLTLMALERNFMQRPDGGHWLQASRRLLITLVNHDPALNWLIAPSTNLPALKASIFWPSLPDNVALPGIWTYKGETTLNGWIEQIELAAGQPLPLLQQALEQNQTQKQNAWKKYLIDVTASLASSTPATLSRGQLIAIGQNQSQAMLFVSRTLDELKEIPPAQSQPWLATLRQLKEVTTSTRASALRSRADQFDQHVRQSLTAWLHSNQPEPSTDNVPSTQLAWLQWQNARSHAVKEAVGRAAPDVQLTRGLFSPMQSTGESNPLSELFPALATLQEGLSPQNNDAGIAAVWLLYQDDARRLLSNALAQSACWLNNQWKSAVIWPTNKDSELRSYEEQQALIQQSVSDFLRGPAHALLTSNSDGPAAADYAGLKVPITGEFIRFIRQTFPTEMIKDVPDRSSTRIDDHRASLQAKIDSLSLKQNELEKKSWKINIASLPATVPGGAKVIPTGTQVTLSCTKGDQQLSSMNFAEKRDFLWQPGQCPSMTLSVIFPDFTANYQLNGPDAWPLFISNLTKGEVLLDSNNFGDSANTLKLMGIKQILVRFIVSNTQDLETAWQNWSDLNNNINDLDAQISSLDERAKPQFLNPISSLPDAIAQCN
ncbi:type VI secretion system protein [Buttiauxella sp. S19-1]|uniref:type VI secretion system protein n=1 Tax=Buttiauxella sp. S19-1 TaxID=941430 RepID=UPI001EDB98D7|nr:type VI secretion system protein [Buttiauxella sp. S19-1]